MKNTRSTVSSYKPLYLRKALSLVVVLLGIPLSFCSASTAYGTRIIFKDECLSDGDFNYRKLKITNFKTNLAKQ